MFSSPGPRATPRRSMKPREPLARPPVLLDRATAETPTGSRTAVWRGRLDRSPTGSVADSTRAGTAIATSAAASRHDDALDRTFWSRDERRAIASAGGLPKEVVALIKASDMVRSPVTGYADLQTGFAFVATSEGCMVWNFARRTQASPTCYVFPAPPLERMFGPVQTPVLVSLHSPGGNTAEPGVILVSPSGEVRYWDNASSALSNVDRYQSVQLDLADDDVAERICKIEGDSYIITTSTSLAFRLTFTPTAGRLVPSVQALARPGGMFARASTTLFSSKEDRSGVRAVASSGQNLLLVAARSVLRWALQPESQKFLQETDLVDVIGQELFENRWSSGNADLSVHDLVATQPEQVIALVSFSDRSAASSGAWPQEQSHAVVMLNWSQRGYTVARTINIAFQAPSDPRSIDASRLTTVPDGSNVFIRFATAVVMVSLAENSPYEEVITLKDPARNAFFGCSASVAGAGKRVSGAALVLMPLTGGLMSLELYTAPISLGQRSAAAVETARVKSQLEQAVFFGDRSENPLALNVTADSESDVAAACEAVSAEILTSRSPYMAQIYELRPQLIDRMQRLRDLFKCIRKNGFLGRVPQASRRRLSRDAEKAKAAVELWEYQDRLMDSHFFSTRPAALLSESIRILQEQLGDESDDDRVRRFFRFQIEHIEQLLEIVYAEMQSALDKPSYGFDPAAWILEANKMFIIVFKAAAKYREEELALYEIDREKPSLPLWTARLSLIDALESLYGSTERLIRDRTRDFGSVVDEAPSASSSAEVRDQQVKQNLLKNHMGDLAAALCINMEDRLRVASRRQLEDGADQQEGLALQRRWEKMKPSVIRPLVGIDRIDAAYDLAEHHSDFETLVWLCHDPVATKGQARIQAYIERLGEEFAFVMYQWYIDNGQYHALLTQDEAYGHLLTKFFEEPAPGSETKQRYPELSWMHHIACKRYGQTASATNQLRQRSNILDDKEFINSIGKLAGVADIQANGVSDKRRQRLVDFDVELDSIQVQDALRHSLQPTGTRASRPTAKQIEARASNAAARPVFLSLFVFAVQKLLAGKALDIEDLVDVLSLKDGEAGQVDVAAALGQLAKDRSLPNGRKQVALISIWRRVFIRDDWTTIANTSGRSEGAQRQILRSTMTYQTLQAIEAIQNFPKAFILAPFTCSQPPLLDELTARFPKKTPDEIAALMADHEHEIGLLTGYIDNAGLESRVKEVAALVQADAVREDEEQVAVADEDVQM